MKVSERLRELYFAKFDDQMAGLSAEQEAELQTLNRIIDSQVNLNIKGEV